MCFVSANGGIWSTAEAERRPYEPCVEHRVTMSVALWVILAMGASLSLSLAVGLVLAAILARMSEGVSEAFEAAPWASAPPRLPMTSTEEVAVEEAVLRVHHRGPRIPSLVK